MEIHKAAFLFIFVFLSSYGSTCVFLSLLFAPSFSFHLRIFMNTMLMSLRVPGSAWLLLGMLMNAWLICIHSEPSACSQASHPARYYKQLQKLSMRQLKNASQKNRRPLPSVHAACLHVTCSYRDKQQKVSFSFQKQLWISGVTLSSETWRAVSLDALHSLCMNQNFPYAKQSDCYTCMVLHFLKENIYHAHIYSEMKLKLVRNST